MPWGWINDMQIFHIKGIHVLLFCALYSSPRHWTVGAPPALPTRKPGLTSAPPWPRYLLSLVWACPRPERFPIPYLHVMNNNTQGRILHCPHCLQSPRKLFLKMCTTEDDRCPVAIFKKFLWRRPPQLRTIGPFYLFNVQISSSQALYK